MDIKVGAIEKGIDIPLRGRRITAELPVAKMEIDDSFAVTCANAKIARSVAASMRGIGKRCGFKMATRVINEKHIIEVRCWRIA